MIQHSISLSPAMRAWIDARVIDGGYIDAAEYIRDLVRRDRDRAAMIDRVSQDTISKTTDTDPDLRAGRGNS